MLAFMWWLVIGVVAGAIARMIVPGRQSMSMLATMALGLVGSIVGGMISWAIWGEDPSSPGFQRGGFLLSSVGAIIVLWIYVASQQRRLSHR